VLRQHVKNLNGIVIVDGDGNESFQNGTADLKSLAWIRNTGHIGLLGMVRTGL